MPLALFFSFFLIWEGPSDPNPICFLLCGGFQSCCKEFSINWQSKNSHWLSCSRVCCPFAVSQLRLYRAALLRRTLLMELCWRPGSLSSWRRQRSQRDRCGFAWQVQARSPTMLGKRRWHWHSMLVPRPRRASSMCLCSPRLSHTIGLILTS